MIKLRSIISLRLRFFKFNDDIGDIVFKNFNIIDIFYIFLYFGIGGCRLKIFFRNCIIRGWLLMDILFIVIIVDSVFFVVFSEL